MAEEKFQFDIQLSVLNHLGRNLYRNFITILGEAISNSWDADAKNVFIEIDKKKNQLIVRDDGVGMNSDDFRKKFLRVGHSKRAGGVASSESGRPFIGAKGIGKLALLSCSKKVVIISKKLGQETPTGGMIVNEALDLAIAEGVDAEKYDLASLEEANVDIDLGGFEKGTILIFRDLNVSVRNTIGYIKQQIAMHFRFSLFDPEFKIFVGEDLVGPEDLKKTYGATQFLWKLNNYDDLIYESFHNLVRQEG